MKLLLKRIYTCPTYTVGHLYVDDTYVCDTIEDTDRGLDSSMTLSMILNLKVKHATAIPAGKYNIQMNIVSPRLSKKQYYLDICKGRVPRLSDVPGFDGILIHVGNTALDSSGCLLVGYNKVKGKVIQSKTAFEKLYRIMKKAYDLGEDITIKIERAYKI